MNDTNIVFENVSKFYGEVLGVNRVDLTIPPGITSLVGPNGSGKTTLMNLMTGLLQPTEGRLTVRGISPHDPERLFRIAGYCAQFDSFPKGSTGRSFIEGYLRVHGLTAAETRRKTDEALDRVSLTQAAGRRIGGYSKGMRQRIKLAQAIVHDPQVLILDEPLNGLDPMARAEMISLFKELAQAGRHLILSSHILHEVDLISDQVILLNEGYIVAEGNIHGVRSEMDNRPLQVVIRCNRPSLLASQVFSKDSVVEARIHENGNELLISTRDAGRFFLLLNRVVLEHDLKIESVAPADDDVQAVYQYLISDEGDRK